MTTRPELRDTSGLLPAVAAVGLFVVMVLAFVGSPIGPATGFPANAETENESLGDASLQEDASIVEENGSTLAVVQREGGNESTRLANETGVNATIVASGGQLYGVVSEPVSITASIGYAMFGLSDQAPDAVPAENFLALFEMIAVVLVAALIGAVMLARREEAGTVVSLFSTTDDESGATVAADGGSESDEFDGGDA